MSAAPVVFLDRDGTLIRERAEPPRSARDVELLPGCVEALASLRRAGLRLVMITNQSAIARGWLRFEQLAEVQRALEVTLATGGAGLDATYFCPHHPREGAPPYLRACGCRKPADGLLRRALAEFQLDAARSWVIGDALRDLEAGARVGARGILVATGKGERESARMTPEQRARFRRVANLREAAATVLADLGGQTQGK